MTGPHPGSRTDVRHGSVGSVKKTRAAVAPLVALLLTLAACGTTASLGALEMDVPDGWTVTRHDADSMQLADGTAGDPETQQAGDATAVFDVYLDSPYTPRSYREFLAEDGVTPTEEELTIDGHDAILFRYVHETYGGDQASVLIPERDVYILYRAAYPDDAGAFEEGLDAFEEAVRSIRFSADPTPGGA